jgi:hypothetical protein
MILGFFWMNTLPVFPAFERVLLTLWVGGLWVSGFIVAPLLFAGLESRAQAGSLAGSLFSIMSFIGLACGTLLLGLRLLRREHPAARWPLLVIVVMLALVLAGEFVLAPMIAELRAAGQVESPRFGQLHGLAAVLFIVNCVLGLVLVAFGQRD